MKVAVACLGLLMIRCEPNCEGCREACTTGHTYCTEIPADGCSHSVAELDCCKKLASKKTFDPMKEDSVVLPIVQYRKAFEVAEKSARIGEVWECQQILRESSTLLEAKKKMWDLQDKVCPECTSYKEFER